MDSRKDDLYNINSSEGIDLQRLNEREKQLLVKLEDGYWITWNSGVWANKEEKERHAQITADSLSENWGIKIDKEKVLGYFEARMDDRKKQGLEGERQFSADKYFLDNILPSVNEQKE